MICSVRHVLSTPWWPVGLAVLLNAGCGPGRVVGNLAGVGHEVLGVDIDPALIAAAEQDHPDLMWLAVDLAEPDLAAIGIDEAFECRRVCGQSMTFLAPHTVNRSCSNVSLDSRDAVAAS